MTRQDMAGTAYCAECKVGATHERGPGTPLSIQHKLGCPVAAEAAGGGSCHWCGHNCDEPLLLDLTMRQACDLCIKEHELEVPPGQIVVTGRADHPQLWEFVAFGCPTAKECPMHPDPVTVYRLDHRLRRRYADMTECIDANHMRVTGRGTIFGVGKGPFKPDPCPDEPMDYDS